MIKSMLIIARIIVEWQSIALVIRALMLYYSTPLTIENISQLIYNLTMLLVEIVPSSSEAVWRMIIGQVFGLILTALLEWLWSRRSVSRG